MPWGQIAAAAIGGGLALFGGERQQSSSKQEAMRNREFQKMMSDTQYQRAMADMRAAGLNPMLAYKQGGAGGASGSMATYPNIGAQAVEGASKGAASAVAVNRNKAEVENIVMDTGLKQADRIKKGSEVRVNNELIARIMKEQELLNQNITTAKAAAAQARATTQFYNTEFGKKMRAIDLTGRSINPFATAGSSARQMTR